MTKSELIQKLADANPHLYVQDCARIVQTVFDEITNSLADSNRAELRGFGAFFVKTRKARMGRNPRTGEKVFVEEKKVPFFRTGKKLHEDLNSSAPAPAAPPSFSSDSY